MVKRAGLFIAGILLLVVVFQTHPVQAQNSCPVCDCGQPVCDADGNCSCPDQPLCECGEAVCSSGQWQCSEAPSCAECTAPVCDSGQWYCEDDGACDTCGDCECWCNPYSYCCSCDLCDAECSSSIPWWCL